MIRCPHCNTVHTLEVECSVCRETHRLEEWRGKERTCTNPACKGPLKINEFVVGGTGVRVAATAHVTDEAAKPERAAPVAEPAIPVAPVAERAETPDDAGTDAPKVEDPAPELPVASGAVLLLQDGEPAGDAAGVNHWLLALLRRHGAMAENLVPGLRAPELVREVADRLHAGQPGGALSREELVVLASRRAQRRGRDRVGERDLAAAILSAAGYGVAEG